MYTNKFPKVAMTLAPSNIDNIEQLRVAWRGGNSLPARRFILEPSNWVTTDASPGGILIPARRFLNGNLETYEK